jgi:hypothetical protein
MFIAPGMSNLAAAISIISYMDTFKIGCNCDISAIEDPLELIDLYEKYIDQILTQN